MGSKANCILLYGDDPVLMTMRRNEVIQSYFHGDPPEPVEVESAGSYDEYYSRLGGQSLFSCRSVVAIRNPFFFKRAAKSEKEEGEFIKFVDMLRRLPSEVLLVLLMEGKIDKRTKIGKTMTELCVTEECSLMKTEDAAALMIRFLEQAGKKISADGRVYISEVVGAWKTASRPLIQTECDKILLMAGDVKIISRSLLESALPDYMDQGVFRFMDKVLAKNGAAVLRDTDRVFTNPEITAINIGFVASRFRKIKMVKEAERERLSEGKLMEAVGAKNRWGLTALRKDAAKITEEDAEWFLVELFRHQYEKRHGSKEETLSDLFLRFCLRRAAGKKT